MNRLLFIIIPFQRTWTREMFGRINCIQKCPWPERIHKTFIISEINRYCFLERCGVWSRHYSSFIIGTEVNNCVTRVYIKANQWNRHRHVRIPCLTTRCFPRSLAAGTLDTCGAVHLLLTIFRYNILRILKFHLNYTFFNFE